MKRNQDLVRIMGRKTVLTKQMAIRTEAHILGMQNT